MLLWLKCFLFDGGNLNIICLFGGLTSKSTAMVMSRRSVNMKIKHHLKETRPVSAVNNARLIADSGGRKFDLGPVPYFHED